MLPPEHAYKRYLNFARTQTIRLAAQVEEAVDRQRESYVPTGLEKFEKLLENVKYELTERVYTPKIEIIDYEVNNVTQKGIITVFSRFHFCSNMRLRNEHWAFRKGMRRCN